MKYSIIIRCYNTLPLIKKCIEAAIQSTDAETEIILVNNHPPYQEVTEYLNNITHPRVTLLDPHKNIGNAAGFNYGASVAKGEYLVILDDDIIVPNNNWISMMSKALTDYNKLAYLSLIWSSVKQSLTTKAAFQHNIVKNADYSIYFDNSYVIFGCVMLKKELWQKHFSHPNLINKDLYGIDGYYQRKAKKLGMSTGYLISHMAEHLGRTEEADLLYGAYKVIYAYKLTKVDYVNWKKGKKKFTGREELALKHFGYNKSHIENLKKIFN